ncbi:MAG: hypothetical protein ABI835_16735 [Chloroflexota bacterium]
MKKLWVGLLVVFVLTSVVSAQDGLFTLYGTDPVVDNGTSIEWDSPYTDPGAVFFYDGKFHMFRNGFKGWPTSVQIGYLTSDDGLNWTEVSEDPVMRTRDVPYAGIAALASDGMVLDDGTWVLYFYTWETRDGLKGPAAIGRATAPAPTGPWTPDPAPILTAGSEGSWDAGMVAAPRIVQTDDGYNMYYTGYLPEGIGTGKIGLATSEDGITWTKYDDPATTDALYAESDPVLTAPAGIDDLAQAMVEITPDGWTMIFRQADFTTGDGNGAMTLNYALSEDGIHWTIADTEPFWSADTVPGANSFWYTAMEYHDDTYYLYIETGIGPKTKIFAATHEGSLTGMEM